MARTPRQLALAYDELDTPADLSPTELLVWGAARAATARAYAPY